MPMQSNNKSGYTGVYWSGVSNKWAAQIKIKGKMVGLGTYENIEDAACARLIAQTNHGFHPNHGMEL